MGFGWGKNFQLQIAVLTIHKWKKLQHITNCKMKMWKKTIKVLWGKTVNAQKHIGFIVIVI